jgi:hypothetical protein
MHDGRGPGASPEPRPAPEQTTEAVALGGGEELVAALIGELGVQERVHGRRLAVVGGHRPL